MVSYTDIRDTQTKMRICDLSQSREVITAADRRGVATSAEDQTINRSSSKSRGAKLIASRRLYRSTRPLLNVRPRNRNTRNARLSPGYVRIDVAGFSFGQVTCPTDAFAFPLDILGLSAKAIRLAVLQWKRSKIRMRLLARPERQARQAVQDAVREHLLGPVHSG